jgi:hypothetical protein
LPPDSAKVCYVGMGNDENLKVRIRNAEGNYLTGDFKSLWFTDDPLKALVFDYWRHQVAQQIENLKEEIGITLEAEPIDPKEIYETCDGCNRLGMPFDLAFDGNRFLCDDCKG